MYLSCSHIFNELSNHPCPFHGVMFLVPFGLPKSVRGEIAEYEYRRREGDSFFGHRTVCDEVRIPPSEAEHPCRGLSSNTI